MEMDLFKTNSYPVSSTPLKKLEVVKRTNEPRCALIYSHDGLGLGHLRRNTTIAKHFIGELPGSSVLMLVGCPLGAFFPLPSAGIDLIKLPSIVKIDTGVWNSRTLTNIDPKIRDIRASTIQNVARILKPDLFLVDHVPIGVWGELIPTLRALKELDDPPVIVLGIREILDDPNVTRQLWCREGGYEAISQYYDEIFIYGAREVFDTAFHYGLKDMFAPKVRYCGFVCSEDEYQEKSSMREDLQIKKQKLIVVTAGGGYDAFGMMRTCLEALRLLSDFISFEAIFITGPLMAHEQRASLEKQSEGLPVRLLRCVDDSLSYLNAADLVIAMAGYNTMCEVVFRLRKKALVIPRLGPSAEQMIRARTLEKRGLIDVVHPGEMSPAKMAARIEAGLEQGDCLPQSGHIETTGAEQAASRLLKLIDSRGGDNHAGKFWFTGVRQSICRRVVTPLMPIAISRWRNF